MADDLIQVIDPVAAANCSPTSSDWGEMKLPPPPKFVKSSHHVVPVLWQRRFAAGGEPGPYYLNVQTGKALKPQGPGDKMAEEYVNIAFDEFYRPSDL